MVKFEKDKIEKDSDYDPAEDSDYTSEMEIEMDPSSDHEPSETDEFMDQLVGRPEKLTANKKRTVTHRRRNRFYTKSESEFSEFVDDVSDSEATISLDSEVTISKPPRKNELPDAAVVQGVADHEAFELA